MQSFDGAGTDDDMREEVSLVNALSMDNMLIKFDFFFLRRKHIEYCSYKTIYCLRNKNIVFSSINILLMYII